MDPEAPQYLCCGDDGSGEVAALWVHYRMAFVNYIAPKGPVANSIVFLPSLHPEAAVNPRGTLSSFFRIGVPMTYF